MALTLASRVKFKDLCEELDRIHKAPATKKTERLQGFIQQCRLLGNKIKNRDPEADISFFPILRLLLPQLERVRQPYGLKETALANLYVRVLCLGKTSQDALKLLHYKAPPSGKRSAGDFAEIAYWVLHRRLQKTDSSLTVEEVNSILDKVAERNAANQSRDDEFHVLIQKMSAFEHKWMIRIVLKDLKLGMGQKRIFNAYHPDAEDLYDVTSCLQQVCDKLHDPEVRIQHGIEVFSPFKPMLLERCKIEEIGKFFGRNETYFVQTKHDGERSQLHMKNGKFKYFTRNGFDITDNEAYGETRFSGGLLTSRIARLLKPECQSIILDGELMGWHKEKKRFGSKGMSFDVKKVSPNSAHQPCFVAFDIIMYNDELLVDKPLKHRLELLETVFNEEEGVLIRSETKTISNREELLKVFNESLDNREEGIVLKKCESIYKPKIREGSGCYKIKAEYSESLIEEIDLLILGGYYGEGKCRGSINSFLMGVAYSTVRNHEECIEFHAVSAVGSGISIEKLEGLLFKLKQYWVNECPLGVVGPKTRAPDVWIHPKDSIILQLRATELIRSSNFPTGYTLRFPRVVAIRDDKPWHDACTTVQFRDFVQDTGVVQKLTKRHATVDDIEEATTAKSSRKVKSAPIGVNEDFIGIKSSDVVRLDRLLDGKECCVINGNEEMSKVQIEKILLEHGAKVVQNPGDKTFCAIVGNANKKKAKNIIQSRKYDVSTLDWLLRVTRLVNLSAVQEWFPWDLLSARESTQRMLAEAYDEYYDSYTHDADMESLKRSLQKAGEQVNVFQNALYPLFQNYTLVDNTKLTPDQYKEIDTDLFNDGLSPYSLLRGKVGYFCNHTDVGKYCFLFLGGIVATEIDGSIAFVFVNRNHFEQLESYANFNDIKEETIEIVDVKWVEDCFRDRKLLPNTEYIVNDRG